MTDIQTHKFKTSSEQVTAAFFDRLGIECIDLDWVAKIGKEDLGEIDGIFLDEENEIIFVYDDSELSGDVNRKISSFLNKWSDTNNQQKLINEKSLPEFNIIVLYIDKIKNSSKKSDLNPIQHAIKENCFVLFKDEFSYFDDISKQIGKWVLNDFYNFLGVEPKKINRTITAIQYYVGDTPAYVYSDRVDHLLKYSFVKRKLDANIDGYQRMLDFTRVKKIKTLLESGKLNAFPNSILLNCIEPIKEPPAPKNKCPKPVNITIPNHFSSCKVIDGQHRILSFSQLERNEQIKFSLPIVLFNNLPIEDEIRTFIEINDNQKRIDPNLTISLKSKLNWNKDSKEYLQGIAYQVIEKLIEKNTTFSKRVYKGFAGEEKKIGKDNKLTVQQFVSSLIKNKIIDKNLGALQRITNDIDTPCKTINEIYQKLVEKDGGNINYYYSNRGTNLILRFIGVLCLNIKKGYTLITFKKGMEDFYKTIKTLIPTLKLNYGAGGDTKSFKQLISALKKTNVDYGRLETNFSKLRI